MTYVTGSVAPVPEDRQSDYLDHVAACWALFSRYGATRMVEAWGSDVPHGKVNDLFTAVEAAPGEAVVLSWLEWPDKETADAAWVRMAEDPAMEGLRDMPFDGSRMIFGGFSPMIQHGSDAQAGYYQGFVLPVPAQNQDRYRELANRVWADMLRPNGATATLEAWGTDVPKGKRTDFHRACKASDDEVPVFSWVAWPDKASCDEAGRRMEAEAPDMSDMPFDGMRMMWGGFTPVFVSDARP